MTRSNTIMKPLNTKAKEYMNAEHVTEGGIERGAIFTDRRDREHFLKRLPEASQRCGVENRSCGLRRRAMRLRSIIAAVVLGVSCVRSTSAGGTWERFRGPEGHGVVEAPEAPVKLDETKARWRVRLPGPGHSSPVVWNDRIFLTCSNDEKKERTVLCLDVQNGNVLWQHAESFVPYHQQPFNSFAASTACVDGERVYVGWVSGGRLEALALDHSGRKVWGRELGTFRATHGAGASPVVVGDVLVIGNDNEGEESFLIGLDTATGQTAWKIARTNEMASYVTPAMRKLADGTVELVFVSQGEGMTGLNPATGALHWSCKGLFTLKSVASPVFCGDLVFASAGRGGGGDEAVLVRAGSDARVVAKPAKDLPYVPTPVYANGRLFLWSDRGTVTCLDPETQKVFWRESVGGQFFASPLCINGKLYNISRKGDVVVLEAGSEFTLLARSQLSEGTHATPAVANGRLYLRTFNHLMCF